MWVWGIFTDFEVNEGMILAKKQAVFAGTKAQGRGLEGLSQPHPCHQPGLSCFCLGPSPLTQPPKPGFWADPLCDLGHIQGGVAPVFIL